MNPVQASANQDLNKSEYNPPVVNNVPIVTGQTYSAQPYGQPTYATSVLQEGNVVSTAPRRRRPDGIWGDGICDWGNNLFPSCYCACCACCGVWILAQMVEKHGYGSFRNVIYAWGVCIFIGLIFQIIFQGGYITIFGAVFVWVYAMALRVYIADKDRIHECGTSPCLAECCIGFWCGPCSIAQMARYTYGYKQVFDGDADIHRPDNYEISASQNYTV